MNLVYWEKYFTKEKIQEFLSKEHEIIFQSSEITPIDYPECPNILNFIKPPPYPEYKFSIGRYFENRPFLYPENFTVENERRTLHMGIDFGAPEGTQIFAHQNGEIEKAYYHSEKGDYGGVLIVRFKQKNLNYWVLYGHISKSSLSKNPVGKKVQAGEVFAWVGNKQENGGYPPHLHWQVSLIEPKANDLPGVVRMSDANIAQRIFPNPVLFINLQNILDAPSGLQSS